MARRPGYGSDDQSGSNRGPRLPGTPQVSQPDTFNVTRNQTGFTPFKFGREAGGGPLGQDFFKTVDPRHPALNLQTTILPFLQQAGPQILPQGFQNLFDIIQGRGQIDPALMNQELAGIGRSTQGRQDALRGQQSAFGLRSPAFGALSAAIGQAGADQAAGRVAQENAAAAARQRSDLANLLLPMLINPGLSAAGLANPSPGGGPSDLEKFGVFAADLIDSFVPF